VIEHPHQLDFIFKRFSAFFAGILLLFRKSLNRHHPMITQSFREIDSSKGTLTNFLLCLKQLVKISLVNLLFQLETPNLNNRWMGSNESQLLSTLFSLQLDSDWNSKIFFSLYYGSIYEYRFVDDFKLKREGKRGVMRGDLRVDICVKKEEVFGEGELDFLLIANIDIFKFELA
jgi:hypothetical protein